MKQNNVQAKIDDPHPNIMLENKLILVMKAFWTQKITFHQSMQQFDKLLFVTFTSTSCKKLTVFLHNSKTY